ncbi:expressed unknown protein [Seminavis robusta]|uniref:Uncharacterized protein n=1 Tax=Seminavis robusta TaxID=568900 RepID=A0A9N8DI41_9STRA|nr:expressed unknown protein [Seminavis robusta]|eukprot:Sro101_g051690.1 n/a (152) ;mRNA; r:80188-80643
MDYIYARTQKQKCDIVLECISEHQANGGRYVGCHEGTYYEATEKKMYAKTIQRLRERNKEFQEKMEKMVPEKETEDPPASPTSTTQDILSEEDVNELCGLFPVSDATLEDLFPFPGLPPLSSADDDFLHFFQDASAVVSDDDAWTDSEVAV